MKVRNKGIKSCLKRCCTVLDYCSSRLSKLYDDEAIQKEDVQLNQSIVQETFEGIEPVGDADITLVNEATILQDIHSDITSEDSEQGKVGQNAINSQGMDKLIMESAKLVKMYDNLASQIMGDSKVLLADVSLKLIENLLLSGCEPIMDDSHFDMTRHRTSPYAFVTNGTTIKATLRMGVIWKGAVVIPAIVEV